MSTDPTEIFAAEATLDRGLLLNHKTRQQLQDRALIRRAGEGLDLPGTRHLAHHLGANATELHLIGLLNAAMRRVASLYLGHLGFQAGWQSILIGSRRHRQAQLSETYRSFWDSYRLIDVPPTALQPHGQGEAVQTARRRLITDLFLWKTLMENPATLKQRPLFAVDDTALTTAWQQQVEHLNRLLQSQKSTMPWRQSLLELLHKPLSAAPDSLTGQADYVLTEWSDWLPNDLLLDLQVAQAVAVEESQPRFSGPGPLENWHTPVDEDHVAAFSLDRDWMSSAVLLAKSIHVWLSQLSQQYQQEIKTLDQIPEAELDRLANWGFNALWLIGIWERSRASRTIKQLSGNPEAEASAYALHNYRVAEDLGGDSALATLEQRCAHRGIRLACDVVPNHTGIDSELVSHHPDWFLQTDSPPYPSYRYDGPDLCTDPQVSIRIEAGYWDHSDAAVTFEHHDLQSGRRRYIYHGNDGTHMPWNDTAQLNFLLPEVRRAMSDLIVETARRFRLIRFDAAMTLARKHYRRLWFPPPGGSAGVPSRSSCWMSDADFNRAFPVEFWREVVDRINKEVPDTLLIAEAFWLMESYFVRTLGMHRVYNSAFMNMLKREENTRLRHIIKETLAYNPEILKRYVNFMNNPDEATAVEQFGKGDKYFGVAVLLATLPGLPMFGHGQVEGFAEKYGMEYRRAYWDEAPDEGFIAHHEQQVFPLLRRRRLFADVTDFAFYDLQTGQGVDENVYAFSNGCPGERYLVIYNNAPRPTSGRLHRATVRAHPDREGQAEEIAPLIEQLGLNGEPGDYCRFRDHAEGLTRLKPLGSLQHGLDVQLAPYQYRVYHDFKVITDADGKWEELYRQLGDRAVFDLEQERLRLHYQPLWSSWQALIEPSRLQVLSGALTSTPLIKPIRQTLEALTADLDEATQWLITEHDLVARPEVEKTRLRADLSLFARRLSRVSAKNPDWKEFWTGSSEFSGLAYPLLCWRLYEQLRQRLPNSLAGQGVWSDLTSFGLDLAWRETPGCQARERDMALVALLLDSARLTPMSEATASGFSRLLNDPGHHGLLGVNQCDGQTWFNRERMQALVAALAFQAIWLAPNASSKTLDGILTRGQQRMARIEDAGYQLDKFLELG
jgi:glycosidase